MPEQQEKNHPLKLAHIRCSDEIYEVIELEKMAKKLSFRKSSQHKVLLIHIYSHFTFYMLHQFIFPQQKHKQKIMLNVTIKI